jgi:hypothetical protein
VRAPRRSNRARVVVAVLGGAAFGFGVGRLAFGAALAGSVWTVLGALLLWWAFSDRFKARPGSPESEDDGDRTIE